MNSFAGIHVARMLLAVVPLVCAVLLLPIIGIADDRSSSNERMWQQLLREAESLGLPTEFLRALPPDFIRFEFDDLHAFAAEYHLGEHRLVLNRSLSFNAAGATLRPLGRMTHKEVETLYHELFHAYVDYLVDAAGSAPSGSQRYPVLTFARVQQHCRYGTVLITPILQRKSETEERFLTDRESWEALNETWAVFIGWVVWNQLDLAKGSGRVVLKSGRYREEWLRRLKKADVEGTLRGYYEPEDPAERGVTQKRFLAAASRLSPQEAEVLTGAVLGFPSDLVRDSVRMLTSSATSVNVQSSCE
jgi:hypothetical protein